MNTTQAAAGVPINWVALPVPAAIAEARRLLKQARADGLHMDKSRRITERAVSLMKPHFSANNPQLADALDQLAQCRYHRYQIVRSVLPEAMRRRLLSRAIKAKKDAVKVLARGTCNDTLARHQLELAILLEESGTPEASARQFQHVLRTIARSHDSKLATSEYAAAVLANLRKFTTAEIAMALRGTMRNSLMSVELRIPPLGFNTWRRVFGP